MAKAGLKVTLAFLSSFAAATAAHAGCEIQMTGTSATQAHVDAHLQSRGHTYKGSHRQNCNRLARYLRRQFGGTIDHADIRPNLHAAPDSSGSVRTFYARGGGTNQSTNQNGVGYRDLQYNN